MQDNQKDLKTKKVQVDHDACIGCGTCVVVSPQVFELNGENKSVVKKDADLSGKENILTSAKACPVSAILVFDDTGNQIYPVKRE